MFVELIVAGQVWAKLRQLGPVGAVLLGIADASVIPTPGSLDILIILLVGSAPRWWWLYVIAATAGSAMGAYITFRIGEKGGKTELEKRIPEKKLKRVFRWSERYGVGAVAIPALLPPPFPLSPFLLAAGAMNVPKKKFLSAYAAGRLVRYSIISLLGWLYGKTVIGWIHEYSKPIIWTLIGLAILGGIAGAIYIYYRKQKGLPALHSVEKKAA